MELATPKLTIGVCTQKRMPLATRRCIFCALKIGNTQPAEVELIGRSPEAVKFFERSATFFAS